MTRVAFRHLRIACVNFYCSHLTLLFVLNLLLCPSFHRTCFRCHGGGGNMMGCRISVLKVQIKVKVQLLGQLSSLGRLQHVVSQEAIKSLRHNKRTRGLVKVLFYASDILFSDRRKSGHSMSWLAPKSTEEILFLASTNLLASTSLLLPRNLLTATVEDADNESVSVSGQNRQLTLK